MAAECCAEAGTDMENAKTKVFAMLYQRGKMGITNAELNIICFRYGARIFELRSEGWRIDTMCEGVGAFRYVLRKKKQGK